MSVQAAMAACDAMGHVTSTCSGFVLRSSVGSLHPSADYTVEFVRHRSQGRKRTDVPDVSGGETEFVTFIREETTANKPDSSAGQRRPGSGHGGASSSSKPSGPNHGRPGGGFFDSFFDGHGTGSSSTGGFGGNGFSSARSEARGHQGRRSGKEEPHEHFRRHTEQRRQQHQHQQQQRHWQQRRQQQQPTPPPPAKRRDYYAILNVKPGANKREVKKAYHAAAKRWHPDKNRQAGQEARLAKAERNFKLIARAYEVLSDPETRAAYDRGEDVDDPQFARRQAAQQDARRTRENVRFRSGPAGREWDFRAS